MRQFNTTSWSWQLFLGLALALLSPLSFAESQNNYVPPSAESEAAKARKTYIERFIKFTQDKNVAGRGKDPNGKVVQGGEKSKFNADDGNSFQGDLTYHDNAFVEFVDGPPKPGAQAGTPPPKEKINEFVSSHGNLSDSSQLERVVYQKHKELTQKEENNPPLRKKGYGLTRFSKKKR